MVHPALFWEALGQHQQGTPSKYKSSISYVLKFFTGIRGIYKIVFWRIFVGMSGAVWLWMQAHGSVHVLFEKEMVQNPSVSSVFWKIPCDMLWIHQQLLLESVIKLPLTSCQSLSQQLTIPHKMLCFPKLFFVILCNEEKGWEWGDSFAECSDSSHLNREYVCPWELPQLPVGNAPSPLHPGSGMALAATTSLNSYCILSLRVKPLISSLFFFCPFS